MTTRSAAAKSLEERLAALESQALKDQGRIAALEQENITLKERLVVVEQNLQATFDSACNIGNVLAKAVEHKIIELATAITSIKGELAKAPSSYKAALSGGSKEVVRIIEEHGRRSFFAAGISEASTRESATQLADKLQKAVLDSKMALGISIVSCRRVGRYDPKAQRPRRIHFTVANVQDAEAIVSARRKLQGPSLVIMDELTPQEFAAQQPLWPLFKEARTAGKKAHFFRARLFVNGEEVKAPVSA